MNGEANANGSATAAWFEWGTSSTLAGAASTAQQSIGAGTSVVSVSATLGGLAAGTRYYYRIVASSGPGRSAGEILNFVTDAPPSATAVRIVTFGDSNTDYGYSGSDPTVRASSYISRTPEVRLGPSDPNSPLQLAGKIEARWKAARPASAITAVNHGIGGTSTTSSRHFTTAPNARTATNGVTRFAAEVLGVGYPWSGGESVNQYFPEGAITRVRAFTPGPSDFAYLSIGTNDPSSGVSTSGTISNLTSMVDQWIASGRAANHLIVTTLAPRNGSNDATFPQINDAIRALGSS
ncbi:MAG: hypothetical protein M3409_11955, partial [Gemmatimonadota bacterium]|nr:hypothetical protein [Gemmatimonadota bacterium]